MKKDKSPKAHIVSESGDSAGKKPGRSHRIVNGCMLGIIIIAAVAAIVIVVVDKFVLNGSFSFFIINLMIDDGIGQFVLQISEKLFLPFFSELKVWPIVLMILIPAALICINVFAVKRLVPAGLPKTLCRILIYLCLLLYIVTVSLSTVYTDYAEHVAKKFILAENIDKGGLKDIYSIVKKNKIIAQDIIDQVLWEIDEPGADVDGFDDRYYMEVTELVAVCFQMKGTVNSAEEHYLRNHFSRAPATLDEMIMAIELNSPFGWTLLPQGDTVYHMQGDDGDYNVKFVSENGYHEAIYNKEGVLLTEKNDPENMGTFNYAGPLTDPAMHAALDVLPYYQYGNCPASPTSSKEDYRYKDNSDAQKYWRDLKNKVTSSS